MAKKTPAQKRAGQKDVKQRKKNVDSILAGGASKPTSLERKAARNAPKSGGGRSSFQGPYRSELRGGAAGNG